MPRKAKFDREKLKQLLKDHVFYREQNGDYLARDTWGSYYGVAIENNLSSICNISTPAREYIRQRCSKVAFKDMPDEWQHAFFNYLTYEP